MGAKLCVENRTDVKIAVFLEQISIRYWSEILPHRRVLWRPGDFHVDRGIYTLRAIEIGSETFQGPNMTKEHAKAIFGGVLLGVGGVALLAGSALIVVPGLGVVLTGIGGAMAFAGGSSAVGASVASAASPYKSAVRRGSRVGESKYVVVVTGEKVKELKWEKEEYRDEDEYDPSTLIYTADGLSDRNNSAQGGAAHSLSDEPTGTPYDCKQNNENYSEVAKRFLKTLKIPDLLLDSDYDKCFCESCSTDRNEGYVHYMGEPPEKFAVPKQYMKFGVKIPPQAIVEEIFSKWHVCYHGTDTECLAAIVHSGRLLKAGDINSNGELRRPGPGRYTEKTAPSGHNVNQYFFTPSIKYTMFGNLYSKPQSFHDPVTNKDYNVNAVLQIRLKPGTYKVGTQTMGATKQIDDNFSNDELEWSTDRETVHYIYGILVRMTEKE